MAVCVAAGAVVCVCVATVAGSWVATSHEFLATLQTSFKGETMEQSVS